MSFDEVRFPSNIAFRSSGGPTRRTDIVTLASGFEERNSVWADSRRRYNVGYGIKSLDDLHDVVAFWEARQGRLRGFRFKDHMDWKSCRPNETINDEDAQIGTGDGTTTEFQLVKMYTSGSQTYTRTIKKPVSGSVVVAVAGASVTPFTTVDMSTGIVTLSAAPSAGLAVTAGFEFDVPVRFDTDEIEEVFDTFKAGGFANIPLIEIRI